MLVMAAVELCHPMMFIIQVETHDVTRKVFHIADKRTRCSRASVNIPSTNYTGKFLIQPRETLDGDTGLRAPWCRWSMRLSGAW
jgi:hypothetical protein